MIHGASDFPVVHSNTFPKKQEAEQNAALHALAEWRYSIVLQGGDGNRSQSSGTDDTSDSDWLYIVVVSSVLGVSVTSSCGSSI